MCLTHELSTDVPTKGPGVLPVGHLWFLVLPLPNGTADRLSRGKDRRECRRRRANCLKRARPAPSERNPTAWPIVGSVQQQWFVAAAAIEPAGQKQRGMNPNGNQNSDDSRTGALQFLSRKTSVSGLIIRRHLADVAYYVGRNEMRETVLDVVRTAVQENSSPGDDVIVLGHSLGSVVAYDLLAANDDASGGVPEVRQDPNRNDDKRRGTGRAEHSARRRRTRCRFPPAR